MSAESLRWVRYDGVFYVAHLVAPADVPPEIEVPPGQALVYFLNEEGGVGSIVDAKDIEPYDPNDKEKASNPAAQLGMEIAGEMLRLSHAPTHESIEASAAEATEKTTKKQKKKELKREVKKEKNEEAETLALQREDENEEALLFDRDATNEAVEREKKRKQRKKREETPSPTPSVSSFAQSDAERVLQSLEGSDEDNADRWGALENDIGINSTAGGRARRARLSDRGGPSPFAHPTDFAPNNATKGPSPLAPYMQRIHVAYQRLKIDAERQNKVLAISEYQLMSLLDGKLRQFQSSERFFQSCEALKAIEASTSEEERINEEDRMAFKKECGRLLDQQREYTCNVEVLVPLLVPLVEAPKLPLRRVAAEAALQQRRLPRNQENVIIHEQFMEPTIAHIFQRHAHAMAPTESAGQEKILRYLDQLKRLTTSGAATATAALQRGLLGRSSGVFDIRVNENWNRAHTLMALAPVQEAQLIKPDGYFSAKYSSSKSKMESEALRKLRLRRANRADAFASGGEAGASPYDTASLALPLHGGESEGTVHHGLLDAEEEGIMALYRRKTLRDPLTGAHLPTRSTGTRLATAASSSHPPLPPYRGMAPGGATGAVASGSGISLEGIHTEDTWGHGASTLAPHLAIASIDHGDVGSLYASDYPALENEHPQGEQVMVEMTSTAPGHAPEPIVLPSIEVEGVENLDLLLTAPLGGGPVALLDDGGEEGVAPLLSAENSMSYASSARSHEVSSTWRSVSSQYSRASSVVNEDLDETASMAIRRRAKRREEEKGNGKHEHGKHKHSWRDGAKRAILEQLTLYSKGLKGKPKVLTDTDTFKEIAVLLLERATQMESSLLGISLKMEVHNKRIKFTKEQEKKLKKSVDSYVIRHFVEKHIGEDEGSRTEASVSLLQ